MQTTGRCSVNQKNVGVHAISMSQRTFRVDGGVVFRIDDVIGVELLEKDLLVHAYPLVKQRRAQYSIKIEFDDGEVAEKWKRALDSRIKRPISPHLLHSTNRVIVFINPFSGQQKAVKAWETIVRPILDQAKLEYDVLLTERCGHARDLSRDLDIDRYDAILVNSGDGLVSEVLCGLLLRKDRVRALKIPIAHIPGGTSNALAAAVNFACNEPFSSRTPTFLENSLMVARPRFFPLRMHKVETEHNGTMAMFMTANWGLIADVDIASERFRWAGMIRLHMESFIRLVNLPNVANYRGRISYIPLGSKEHSHRTMLQYDVNRKKYGTGHFDYGDIPQASSPEEVAQEHYKSIEDALKDQASFEVPALDEPVGKEWVVVEGEFVMVNVVSLSHLGSDLPLLPCARFDEEIMYIVLVDWKTVKSRWQVMALMLTMESSRHLAYNCVQVIPVRACRVEPLDNCGGYMAIDGEPCQIGSKYQVVPTRHCGTIIGRKEVVRPEK